MSGPLVEAEPGEPLPGLTTEELAAFRAGESAFNRQFTEADGLGPVYNQDRCSSCHDLPTSGGHGEEPVSKATRYSEAEGCSLLSEAGGDLFQQVVSAAGRARGLGPEPIPSAATASVNMRAPQLYGLGLVAAVPQGDILSRADPDDLDGDGISGRPALDARGRVGRFGWKAQHASLSEFIEEAIRLEMGITTPLHPDEAPVSGEPIPGAADPAPDPEVDDGFLSLLDAYVRGLAPPEVRPVEGEWAADVEEGARIFEFAGCESCHVPSMETGPSTSRAHDRKRFRIYSDLLLHDLGPEVAGTCSPLASPTEWRTAPLVGLGLRQVFLHDGRAQRLGDAVELHGGEAAKARETFRSLTPSAREQLLAFLRSL